MITRSWFVTGTENQTDLQPGANPEHHLVSNISSTPSAEDVDYIPQQCGWPECNELQIFKLKSVYKKHMNKHLRPFKCTESVCKSRDFANAGDLRRHQQEVHGSCPFKCHIRGCKRSRNGFGQKENLMQHIKRSHGNVDNEPAAGDETNQGASVEELVDESVSGIGEKEASDMGVSVKAWLTTKLKGLEEKKMAEMTRFDSEIAAIRKVLSS